MIRSSQASSISAVSKKHSRNTPILNNSALLTDAFRSLRCACGAAKRER
jgi:hypothetical protein